MRALFKRSFLVWLSMSVGMLFTAGCASGGFKLTREYARWVNSKNIILRIIIYLLTGIVFAITLMVDFVLFNTLDFWQGKVSQGDYQFKGEEKMYYVKHEIVPNTLRKKSTIRIVNEKDQSPLQTIVLSETNNGEIEMYVDGKIRAHVKNISSLPVVSVYNKAGQFIEDQILRYDDTSAVAKH